MNLSKHVLITGTTSGLGRGLLEYYAGAGIQVTAVNRRKCDELEAHFPRVSFRLADVRQQEKIRDLIVHLAESGDLPDLFILNAGINRVDNDSFFDVGIFNEVMETNLLGVMNFVAPITQLEKLSKKVSVVAISSMGSGLPNPYCLSYHVSKRALTASFDVLSEMYAGTPLCFKQVVLGPVPTAIHDTSHKFPKIMSEIKKIFSVSLPEAVQSIVKFSETDQKTLILPWPAYFLFRAVRMAQTAIPGFYRGRKTMDGRKREPKERREETVKHA